MNIQHSPSVTLPPPSRRKVFATLQAGDVAYSRCTMVNGLLELLCAHNPINKMAVEPATIAFDRQLGLSTRKTAPLLPVFLP